MRLHLHSGEWSGTYEQQGQHFPQRMTLEFADGVVRGDGIDGIGTFALEGEYRSGEEQRVGWIKTYHGAHSVLYRGVIRADGHITGQWSVGAEWTGAFDLAASPRSTRTIDP